MRCFVSSVASPAQATVAEPAGQKHVSQKPDAMSRSTASHSHRSKKHHQSSEPVVLIEPLDTLKAMEKRINARKLETKSKDTKSKEKPGGPVVMLEMLDEEVC